MAEWAFVLTPVLVLPIVLLFRFVGCAQLANLGGPEPDPVTPPEPERVPRYRDYIMGVLNNPGSVPNAAVQPNKADVIAYWRLVDEPTDPVAHDEKQFRHGEFHTVPALPQVAGSEGAQGNFFTGQHSLIKSDPKVMCRKFSGGFVVVPYIDDLYSDQFTIEAWVEPGWNLTKDYQHVLFSAGGHYRKSFDPPGSESFHGFIVYADGMDGWQVQLAPGFEKLTSSPIVSHTGSTHIAVTVGDDPGAPGHKKVRLFVNAVEAGPPLNVTFYSPPEGAPLYIGIQNDESDPNKPTKPTQPVLSLIQEVVLHKKALSKEEIENHVAINK